MKKKQFVLLLFICAVYFYAVVATMALTIKPTADSSEPPKAVIHYFNSLVAVETSINQIIGDKDKVSLTIYEATKEGSKRILRDTAVAKCRLNSNLPVYPSKGQACYSNSSGVKSVLIYVLNTTPARPGKYNVVFNITDEKMNENEQLVAVSGEFEKVVPVIDLFNRNAEYYAPEPPTPRVVKDRNPNSVVALTLDFKKAPEEYRRQRIAEIYNWLDQQKDLLKNSVTIRVEPETEKGPPQPYSIKYLRIEPMVANNLGDLIRVLFITDKDFPSDKFAIEIGFPDTAPPELSGKWVNSLDGVAQLEATKAKDVGSDTKLGLRDFKSKFDFGVSLASSVETEEKNGVNVRSRKNKFLVDMIFVPIIRKPLDSKFNYLITPFFIDAKVSSSKISKDTLSLNRILIGTQLDISKEIKVRDKNGEKKGTGNILNYVFRGINASDRDFKRAEAKFNFEFRPFIYDWYNPLDVQSDYEFSELLPDNPPSRIPVGWFGYQIQPFAGFEVGRIYRVRRDAFNNENSDRNLRRLFFGMDLSFNITRRATLKLSDTFYVRGESKDARTRNYFSAELEIPFYRSSRFTQNAYLSFKKGDEPPFATPAQNALILGYRITTNLWSRKP